MRKNFMARKGIVLVTVLILLVGCLSGCGLAESKVNDLNGSITGNTYLASFYTNDGTRFMEMSGQKIDLHANIIKERDYSQNGGWGYTHTLSSVVTITIDGEEVENCGSTVIFSEKGLNPEVDFQSPEVIESTTDGRFSDNTIVASNVNRYKNMFGKPRVVVIQSQLGNPICAFSGDSVYWEVCQDLPKTTKLMIDGKALYIHRANFQIIDKSLLD